VLVDGPPRGVPLAVDLGVDLVHVPCVAGLGLAAPQPGRVLGSEVGALLPHRLGGDDHTAGEQQLLDLTKAERKRWYSHTQCAMISAGCRNPLYDGVSTGQPSRQRPVRRSCRTSRPQPS
jgi:hypothetical protein